MRAGCACWRVVVCWFERDDAAAPEKNHVHGAAGQQGSFERRLFTAVYGGAVLQLDLDDRIGELALIQRRSSFGKVFAALLVAVHTGRGECEIEQVMEKVLHVYAWLLTYIYVAGNPCLRVAIARGRTSASWPSLHW